MRAEKSCLLYSSVPDDSFVYNHFTTCILKERHGEPLTIPLVSNSFNAELKHRAFFYDESQERDLVEKEWPLGPTSKIGEVWPFMFISTDGDYDEVPDVHADRFFVCGLVSVDTESHRKALIDLPEVTAGFGVLRDIAQFLPPSISSSTASKFQYYLKSAMPFGSPVCTSVDDIHQFHSTARSDNVQQSQTNGMSTQRIPSWKPFPIVPNSSSSFQPSTLKLYVSEKVSFEIISGEATSSCSASGSIMCDSDIPGTPEITMPIQLHHGGAALTVHACAKILHESSASEKLSKVSFIPLSNVHPVCMFNYPALRVSQFPIVASYRLFQIAPTQFRFNLSVRLKILLSRFHVTFGVAHGCKITALPHTTHSSKTKSEFFHDAVTWTFKSPTTFNPDGEDIDGIIETETPPIGELEKHARIHFTMTENHFSRVKILKDNIAIFPNTVAKTNINVSYEMSTDECLVANQAVLPNGTQELPVDFTNCIQLASSA